MSARRPSRPEPCSSLREAFDHALGQPYIRRTLVAAQAGAFPPGSLCVVRVLHDDGCPRLDGTGLCSCNPEIHVERMPEDDQAVARRLGEICR